METPDATHIAPNDTTTLGVRRVYLAKKILTLDFFYSLTKVFKNSIGVRIKGSFG